MSNIEFLKVYKENKTNTTEIIKKHGLKEIIKRINSDKLPNNYEYRTSIGYPLERKNVKDLLLRKFVVNGKKGRISPEHAQKFYLYEYSKIHKKKIEDFGYIIGYELPFFKKRGSGAIDLIAYDEKNNLINLIELKNCAMGEKKDSHESIYRAILEIETYARFVNEIIKYEKSINDNRLYNDIVNRINELYKLNISLEKLKKSKIVKNILIPENIYESGKNNKREMNYYKDLPKDINIYYIRIKDYNFDTNQIIGNSAKDKELIFKIWKK